MTTDLPAKRYGVWVSLALCSLLVWAVLTALHLYYGELNQDEGWYLYAAQMVQQGQMPYADFAFTQGPVFPLVYGWLFPLVEMWGVGGARLATALLGLLAVFLASGVAFRLAPARWALPAALLTFILLSANTYHTYFSTIVKTYSLAAVLLSGAVWCWVEAHRRPAVWFVTAGILFGLTAGVRVSAGAWLAVCGLALLLRHRKRPYAWAWFGCGGALGLLWAFGPAFWRDAESAWFWLATFHGARLDETGGGGWFLKVGFLSRFVQGYTLPFLLALVLAGVAGARRCWPLGPEPAGVGWTGVAVVTLVHMLAPFPYDDYQVFVMPVAVALLAAATFAAWDGLIPPHGRRALLCFMLTVAFLALCTAFASPLNKAWFIRERDLIWWRMKEQPDLVVLQETGRWLSERAAPGDQLITMDLYLAVEAGLPVPAGFEMGPFSYYPGWSDTEVARRQVLNEARARGIVAGGTARWLAYSDYGFAIAAPGIVQLPAEEREGMRAWIGRYYDLVYERPHFGQAHTTLRIYERTGEP